MAFFLPYARLQYEVPKDKKAYGHYYAKPQMQVSQPAYPELRRANLPSSLLRQGVALVLEGHGNVSQTLREHKGSARLSTHLPKRKKQMT